MGAVISAAAFAKRTLIVQCNRYHPWNAWNPWYRCQNNRFDRRYRVDTAGTLTLPEYESDPRFKYSETYDPTPHPIFFRLMRQINVDFSRFVFIDFGCGKGKVLLLAAQLGFKRIIGVELSAKLVELAQGNVTSYIGRTGKEGRIQLVCLDAAEFQIPYEPAICWFYNPFKPEVMSSVLENIRRSLAAASREIYIMYLYPIHHDLLDKSGFLIPVRVTPWYAIYKAQVV